MQTSHCDSSSDPPKIHSVIIKGTTLEMRYMSMLFMQLAGRKDDPLNMVHMELLIRSPLLPGSESVLGKATLHIHDIIHVSLLPSLLVHIIM